MSATFVGKCSSGAEIRLMWEEISNEYILSAINNICPGSIGSNYNNLAFNQDWGGKKVIITR